MLTRNLNMCSLLFQFFLLHFFLSCAVVTVSASTSIDPCDIGPSFMYCVCNQPEEPEIITCNISFNSSIDDPVWLSLQKLESAVTFKLLLRKERILDYFLPLQIFAKMRKLQYYYARGGNIGSLPSFAFANSTSIDQINLVDNNISQLNQYALANMINLTHLELSDNIIHEINRNVFFNLPNLAQLELDGNGITTIHDHALHHLVGLEELELQKNNLTVITREVFSGLGKVKRLDLSRNTIEMLGDNVFSELKNLYDIDLMGNKIVYVSPTAFDGLGAIGRLNLKDNKLVQIHSTTFEPLYKIHFLDLRQNLLEELDIRPIYKNFLTAGQLMIEGNRFKCQCQIIWIQQLYKSTKIDVIKDHLDTVECELPQKNSRHLSTTATDPDSNGISFGNRNFTTVIAIPQEQTTTYALDAAKKNVMQIKFPQEFACHSSNRRNWRLSTTSTSTENPTENHGKSKIVGKGESQYSPESYHSSVSSTNTNNHHHHQHPNVGSVPSASTSIHNFQTISNFQCLFMLFLASVVVYFS